MSRSKRACSAGGEEAEEGERVLAHVGVGEERDLVAWLAEPVEGAEGDGDAVADAAHVDDDLLRFLAEQAAPELRDHEGTPAPRAQAGAAEGDGQGVGRVARRRLGAGARACA